MSVGHSELLRRKVKASLGLISVKQKAHQQSTVGMTLSHLQAKTTMRRMVRVLRGCWAPRFSSCSLGLQCRSSIVFPASSYSAFCSQPTCSFLILALLSSCPLPTDTREPVREDNHSRVQWVRVRMLEWKLHQNRSFTVQGFLCILFTAVCLMPKTAPDRQQTLHKLNKNE